MDAALAAKGGGNIVAPPEYGVFVALTLVLSQGNVD